MANIYLQQNRTIEPISLGSELKRLLGGPYRALFTLVCVLVPLMLSLLGAADWVQNELYSLNHPNAKDKRANEFFLNCLTQKKLCNAPTWNNTHKILFSPLHQFSFIAQLEPLIYVGLFVFAFLTFVSIGNPRLSEIGQTLREVFGLKTATKKAGQFKEPIPTPEFKNLEVSWPIGGYFPRNWQPNPGYFWLVKAPTKLYRLSIDILRTNLLIVAPPGSGKTYSIFRPFVKFARNVGAAAIFFDSKGADFDSSLFDYNFDMSDPAHSIKLNLFEGETPEQAGERLGEALIPNLSEEKRYFSDVAKDAMAALVSCHHVVYSHYPDLTDLLLYLTEPTELNTLYEQVQKKSDEARSNPQPDSLPQREYMRLCGNLKRIMQLNYAKNDALGALITALTPLTASDVSKVLVSNSMGDSHTIAQLMSRPGLVRFALPIAKNPRIAPIIGRLVLAQFNFYVLDPNCNTRIFKVAAVDEASNFITGSIAKGMAQARSNNAGFMLALQTLSQIADKSLLDNIFAAAGTKIVLPGVSDEDAERFSKTFGELEMPYVTRSQAESKGTNRNTNRSESRSSQFEVGSSGTERGNKSNTTTGSASGHNNSKSKTMNYQTRLRRRFLPSEIREMPTRFAIIESSDAYGQRWYAEVINMDAPLVQKLIAQEAKQKDKYKKKQLAKSEPELKLLPAPAADSGNATPISYNERRRKPLALRFDAIEVNPITPANKPDNTNNTQAVKATKPNSRATVTTHLKANTSTKRAGQGAAKTVRPKLKKAQAETIVTSQVEAPAQPTDTENQITQSTTTQQPVKGKGKGFL